MSIDSIGFLFLSIFLFIIPLPSVSGKISSTLRFKKNFVKMLHNSSVTVKKKFRLNFKFQIVNVEFAAKCANNTQSRIYGGKEIDIDETPYQVFIKFVNRYKQSDQFMCGGAIIGERWVLTARHCLQYENIWTIYVNFSFE